MSEVYDHKRSEAPLQSPGQMEEYRAIAARLAQDQPGPVLDWGCGYGQVSDLLIQAGLETTAFDYQDGSEGWFELAKSRTSPRT